MSTQEQPDGGGRVAPIDLGPGVPARAYALELIRIQVESWRSHEEGARAGDDPRHVHAMRVAAQRARSALGIFRDVLPEEAGALRERLGASRRAFGAARDLDVQLQGLRASRTGAITGPAAIRELELHLEEWRLRERPRVESALDDVREPGLELLLARMAGAPEDARSSLPIERVAPKLLRRLRRRARRALGRLDAESHAEAFHELRRRCRELRYMAEFVMPLWPKEARAFARRVVRLQDRLGESQDAEVSRALIERLLLENGARLGGPAIFEAGRLHERTMHHATDDVAALVRRARKTLEGRSWRSLAGAVTRTR